MTLTPAQRKRLLVLAASVTLNPISRTFPSEPQKVKRSGKHLKGTSEMTEASEIIEAPEEYTKTPPKPRGELASIEEFRNDPKAYSMARGLRPQGLRNNIIVPTNVQVRKLDGTFGEMTANILRRIDFSKNYRGHGINAKKRARRQAAYDQAIADHIEANLTGV